MQYELQVELANIGWFPTMISNDLKAVYDKMERLEKQGHNVKFIDHKAKLCIT